MDDGGFTGSGLKLHMDNFKIENINLLIEA